MKYSYQLFFTQAITGTMIWYGVVKGSTFVATLLSIWYLLLILIMISGGLSLNWITESIKKNRVTKTDLNLDNIKIQLAQITPWKLFLGTLISLFYIGLFIYLGSVWFTVLSLTTFVSSRYILYESKVFKNTVIEGGVYNGFTL